MPFVVDSQGRLVAAASIGFATGQDMTSSDIVRSFVDDGAKAQLARPANLPTGRREQNRNVGDVQPGVRTGLGCGRAKTAG